MDKITELEQKIKDIDTTLLTYKDVEKTISKLKAEKKKHLKEIDEIKSQSLSFLDLFEKWQGKSGGNKESYLPSREEYPNYRSILGDYGRRETVDVKDSGCWDDMYYFLFPDDEDTFFLKDKSFDELIKFLDDVEEELNKLEEEEQNDHKYSDLYLAIVNEDLISYVKAANEVMSSNLASFKYDW